MPEGQLLDTNSRAKLAGLAAEMGSAPLQPAALRGRLLDVLLELVPAQGPCSVIQFNRFVTEGGGPVTLPYHNRQPSPEIVAGWNDHTRKAAAKMEHRLFARKGKRAVGSARLADLIDPNEWPDTPLPSLAKQADLGDMAYLWIRCSDEDLWVVCLRRRSFETAFTDRDFSVLEELGLWFGGTRQSRYVGDQQVLTDRELECVRLRVNGKSAPEAARALGIETKAYEKHLADGRKKLSATGRFELLNKLLDR
jgi:DNA-binding CsgD family transcriptional regulator